MGPLGIKLIIFPTSCVSKVKKKKVILTTCHRFLSNAIIYHHFLLKKPRHEPVKLKIMKAKNPLLNPTLKRKGVGEDKIPSIPY